MEQWSNPSLVMMRECPCSTKTREVLGNPSPPPSRFSLAVGFAPLDPRGAKPTASVNLSRFPSTLEISLGLRPREIPRVSGCKTHGLGKSLKISLDPREIGRRGWISQYLPRLDGARIQYPWYLYHGALSNQDQVSSIFVHTMFSEQKDFGITVGK